jgi:hypothetical protein
MLQAKTYEHVFNGTMLISISGMETAVMVTCTKCGTENVEGAKYCVDCGAALSPEETRIGRRVERGGRPRDECFGLPHGGAIFGLFIGAIIILWGLTEIFGWQVELGTYAIIIVGLLIVAGAIYGLTRRRS